MNKKRKTSPSDQESSELKVGDPGNDNSQESIVHEDTSAAAVNSRSGLRGHVYSYWSHKKWTIPATVLVLLLLVLLIPTTRYKVLGLFLKESVGVSVIDSTTNTPISGAHLISGNVSVTTAVNGKASLKIPVGNNTIAISKQYYQSRSKSVLVTYTAAHNSVQVRLVATGRQVPITVLNKVTNKPVADAEIKVLDTEAKTDKNGKAIIVLPVKAPTRSGTINAAQYNKTAVKVQVTSQAVAANIFALTPAGSIYFLSNLSGKIDVVKTNLDGTNRQTVLAGTGNESPTDTVLLASRDWKYLALLTQRSAEGNPELDLIDTSTGAMSNIDEGDATFTLDGWSGDRFIYQVSRNNVQIWQNGQQVLKSFNAPTKSITVLAQTIGAGEQYSYLGQQFGSVNLLNNQIVYSLNWDSSDQYTLNQNNKQATLNSVNADGSDNTVIKSYNAEGSINVEPYSSPNSLSVQLWDDGNSSYFEYQNNQTTPLSNLTNSNFYNNNYPTYLLSPSGNHTFWSEPTDGKNTLFVGDKNGNSGTKIAILSDYSPYGWYTDSYLLVSKNGSELYIMPMSGGTPIPISDYFKPSQFYNNNYGGGYGGL